MRPRSPYLGDPPRLPPSAPSSEIAILGSLLIDREAIVVTSTRLSPDMFHRPAHAALYRSALALHERGEVVDPITLSEELRRGGAFEQVGGVEYMEQLIEATPSSSNVSFHIGRVQAAARLRSLVQTAQHIIRDAYEDGEQTVEQILDRAEGRISRFRSSEGTAALEPLKRYLHLHVNRLQDAMVSPDGVTGLRTGFPRLDRMLTGLHPGDLCIVAARPSMGKTSWALNVATNAALDARAHVGVFSLEMSRSQLALRLLCGEARIDLLGIRAGTFSREERDRLARASGHLNAASLWIDDSAMLDMPAMRAKARRLRSHVRKMGGEVGLLIVDYLQLISGEDPRASRVNQVGKISRGLKALARELHLPVLALSQLSRAPEQREDRRPILSDLRESGSIEQDADTVLFLFRQAYYDRLAGRDTGQSGESELIVAKQRNGPTGLVRLYFHAGYMRFDPMEVAGVGGPPAPQPAPR
jgi:replicative DNA helicase